MHDIRRAVLDDNNGERMVPETSGGYTFWEHVFRYAFACRFVKQKRVLDIACGEGYGAASLQMAGAHSVVGIDVCETACIHARRRYGVDARTGTADRIPLPDASVDIVVSFETIEHVAHPTRFLDECSRVLGPRGMLVISTPNKGIYTKGGGWQNPHHCSEMTQEEFSSALSARFDETRLFTQRPDTAAFWSMRSLVCNSSPWNRIRGFQRLRCGLQAIVAREAIRNPTEDQRKNVCSLILAVERGAHPLSPFAVRPLREWTREKPIYIIAVATRIGSRRSQSGS
jgi:SAM-dependent methyltransferase